MKFELHCGQAEDILPTLAANSVDSCVHDGPYGIRFMGKAWDSFDIDKSAKSRALNALSEHRTVRKRKTNGYSASMAAGKYQQDANANANQRFQQWTTIHAKEVYRVLKPGAYFLSFCSPRTAHRLVSGIEDAGFEIRDTLMWVFASGFPKSFNLEDEWRGWGSALKPAYEPIVMARKPLEKGLTLQQNMEKWGTGCVNIEASRVPGEPWRFGAQTDIRGGKFNTNKPSKGDVYAREVSGGQDGRWPSNLILDGSAEVRAQFPVTQRPSGKASGATRGQMGTTGIYGKASGQNLNEVRFYGDTGSASRFFYVPKISRADRNEGCNSKTGNSHPTVKPTELMQYLVRMVTRPGGTCLDHMCGSGSTGKACAIEDMDFVGIDEDAAHIEVSRLRIQYIIDHYDLFSNYVKPK